MSALQPAPTYNDVQHADVRALQSRAMVSEDLTGLKCPQPILRCKKALAKLDAGQVVHLLTTDPAAVDDLTVFCYQTGHDLLAQCTTQQGVHHWIARKPNLETHA